MEYMAFIDFNQHICLAYQGAIIQPTRLHCENPFSRPCADVIAHVVWNMNDWIPGDELANFVGSNPVELSQAQLVGQLLHNLHKTYVPFMAANRYLIICQSVSALCVK